MNLTFVITNDKHHHEMMLPLAQQLAARHRIHCVSFCEFRGLDTPLAPWQAIGATISRVPPRNIRPKPGTADALVAFGESAGASRSRLHALIWRGLLRHFAKLQSPDLVVVPNDAAYPSSYLCADLKRRRIPFVLVQEGIRFPWGTPVKVAYGSGGANAIACWGEGAVDFFTGQGVPTDTLHATGNPRYDAIVQNDWAQESSQLKRSGVLPKRYLLFVSNPIDDQGFCSRAEKLAAFAEFCNRTLPIARAVGLTLAVKLHGRESEQEFMSVLKPGDTDVRFLREGAIHAVLRGAEAVVVWASTAGLEAILHDRPLGVLEVPRRGFIFDYVERGAALGLTLGPALPEQLRQLLQCARERREKAKRYLDWHLACRGYSAVRIAELIESMLGSSERRSESCG